MGTPSRQTSGLALFWNSRRSEVTIPFKHEAMATTVALVLCASWIILLHIVDWPIWRANGLPGLRFPNEINETTTFLQTGRMLAEGAVPYLGFWDSHFPLIHFLNGMALKVGGELATVWLLSLAAGLLGLILGYRVMRDACGAAAALLGTVFYAFSLHASAINQVETYALPLQWLAASLVWGRPASWGSLQRALLLGTTGGFLVLLRPNLTAIVWCVAVFTLLNAPRTRARLSFVAATLAGLTIPCAVAAVYLLAHGALGAFWDEVVRFHLASISTTIRMYMRTAFAGLTDLNRDIPLVLPLAGWGLAAFKALAPSVAARPGRAVWLLAAWLPTEIWLAAAAAPSSDHAFIPLIPPLAMLVAFLSSEMMSAWPQGGPAVSPTAALSIAFALVILPAHDVAERVAGHGVITAHMQQVASTAAFVRERTQPHETLLVWGPVPDVYVLANRRPATPLILPFPLLTPAYTDASRIRQFLTHLCATPPAFIVDTTPGRARPPGTAGEPGWQPLAPPLNAWDADWRYPDTRKPEFRWWQARSLLATPMALQRFFDFVSSEYSQVATVGPYQWSIYQRRPSMMPTGTQPGSRSDACH